MLLHIALPSHHTRERLTRCCLDAFKKTTTRPYIAWVVDTHTSVRRFSRAWSKDKWVLPLVIPSGPWEANGSEANGVKLDAVLAAIPKNAEWLFVCHNDSAPMRAGWFEWLRDRIGDGVMGGFHAMPSGLPSSIGSLYRVDWLRASGASFRPQHGRDVCDSIPKSGLPYIAANSARSKSPWWLRTSDVARDEQDRLLFAHLGGGTTGSVSWRLPWRLWPFMVWRHLNRSV